MTTPNPLLEELQQKVKDLLSDKAELDPVAGVVNPPELEAHLNATYVRADVDGDDVTLFLNGVEL